MGPLIGGFMCMALAGGGGVCFRSDQVSHDTAPMEHLVSITCADRFDKMLNVPKCDPSIKSLPPPKIMK